MTYLALAVTDSDPSPLLIDGSSNIKATWAESRPALPMLLNLRVTGATPETTWNTLARKLYTDAPAGAGPDGIAQTNLVLIMQLPGANKTYIDVIGVSRADRSLFRRGMSDWSVTLITQPYARGAPITQTGLVVPSGGGGIWLGEIAGTYPAYARLVAADTSANGKRVVSFFVGQRAGSQLVQADQIPIMNVVPQTPGISQVEATARGGTASKLTLTAAMQAICRAAGPTTGRHNGRMRAWARLRSSAAVIGQPTNAAAAPSAAAGSIGTASITAVIVPYNGSAPYVSGVNGLGTPSAYIQSDLRLLVAGGTQQVALTPQFYDDFELNTLERWFPGVVSLIGGSSTAATAAAAKDTGTYGLRLTAVSPAATLHSLGVSELVQTSPALPTSKRLSAHGRLRVTTETNQESSATTQGLRMFARLPLPTFTPVQSAPAVEIVAITDSTNNQVTQVGGGAGSGLPCPIYTAAAHGLSTGNTVILSGLTGTLPSLLNGTWVITVTGASTFTIPSQVGPTLTNTQGNVYKVTSTPVPITTATAHGLVTGDTVVIAGSNTTPSIDGQWVVTVTGSTTFTIPAGVVTTPQATGVTSGAASTGTGKVYKVSANQAFGLGTTDGTNWGLYASPNPSGIGSLTLVGGSTQTLAAGFHDVEITVDQSSTADTAVRLTIGGAPAGGAFVGAIISPQEFVVQAVAVANGSAATETLDLDTFSIDDGYLGAGSSISGYALIYSWTAAPNAGGYLLKYLEGSAGVWNSIDAGLVTTYTLATLLPAGAVLNSPPPSSLPALVAAQVQLFAGLAGSSLRQPWTAVQTLRNSNAWEWRDLGAGSVPPVPVRQGSPAPSWDLELRASGTVGETIECDAIAYCDDRLDKTQVEQLALSAPATFVLDTGPNGVPGCEIVTPTTLYTSNFASTLAGWTPTNGTFAWGAAAAGALNDYEVFDYETQDYEGGPIEGWRFHVSPAAVASLLRSGFTWSVGEQIIVTIQIYSAIAGQTGRIVVMDGSTVLGSLMFTTTGSAQQLQLQYASAVATASGQVGLDTGGLSEAVDWIITDSVSVATWQGIGQAGVSAPLRLGPGATEILVLPSVADGSGGKVSDIDAALSLEVDYTPLFPISAGA